MDLTEVEKNFSDVGIVRGCVFLLSEVDAIRFIRECKASQIPLLGASGFRVLGDKIQPDQSHEIDLNGVEADSHEIVESFIDARHGMGLWFEIGHDGRRQS